MDFSSETLTTVGIYVICLVLSIAVHEYCHAVMADRLGDPTPGREERLTLNPIAHTDPVGTLLMPIMAAFMHLPMLGWGKPVNTQPSTYTRKITMRGGMALVAAAGPFGNLVLVLLALGIAALIGRTAGISKPVELVLHAMIQLNVVLMVFNLLPLHPLDGGKILAAFLPTRFQYIDDFLLEWGRWILLSLVMFGGPWLYRLLAPITMLADNAYFVAVYG